MNKKKQRADILSTPEKNRIALLDIIRGLAVLGILLMNIRLFSEPYAAYFNPTVYGDYTGLNKLWWNFQYIVADQKFMAIFSMLFGASTAIICDGLVRRGDPVAITFAKRNAGLLLIGLAHAYLLWHGDILVPYALVSILPFLLRNVRWQYVAFAGIGFLTYGTYSSASAFHGISSAPEHIQQLLAQQMWRPPMVELQAEMAAFQGSWLEQLERRASMAWHFETDTFLNWGLWRIAGLMLLGLALYRSGFLKGAFSGRFYGVVAILCLGTGFTLVAMGLKANVSADWSFPYSMLYASIWNYWGSVIVAVGYIAFVGFLLNATKFRFGFNAFANVGKAALSNYLLQTIVCVSIFYGFGGGLIGELARWETAGIVLAVWAAQLILSSYWFRHQEKGPVEAAWHVVTYSRWLPRRQAPHAKE